jgi:RAB protein geranylgeranyltransferase component A
MHDDESDSHPSTNEEEMSFLYDVVICGTDLIQSILSSALSRAGKKVLHCDGQEWYGGLDAVLHIGSTMDSFIGECEERFSSSVHDDDNNGKEEVVVGGDSSTLLHLVPQHRQGDIRVHSQTFIPSIKSSSESMDNINDNSRPEVVQEITTTDAENANKDSPTLDETNQPSVVHPLEKGFCLDLTPNLLYASGDAVDGLVKSGVSEYLEFKSLKGLYLLTDENEKSTIATKGRRRGRVPTTTTAGKNSKDNYDGDNVSATDRHLALYRVPCSKGDVFRSELLSPVDKRRLMKFLQLTIDYGMATQGGDDQSSSKIPIDDDAAAADDQNREKGTNEHDDSASTATTTTAYPNLVSSEDTVQSINERHLHRGRALSRPQNKALPSSSEMDALVRSIHDNTSFSDYLTQVAKLPAQLSNVILYAMALAPFGHCYSNKVPAEEKDASHQQTWQSSYSTKHGVDDLVRHLTAIGRFGDTAFLVPMYGSGELSQAFCRSGAVYGSTYMLRRSPTAISLDNNNNHHNDNSTHRRVQGIILRGEQRIGGIYDDHHNLDTEDVSDRTIPCKHVIIPGTMMMRMETSLSSSATGKTTRTYRRISVLQGKLMLDQIQTNDITNGSSSSSDTEQRHAIIIPPGTCGLGNTSAIHGVVLDETAFVAPPSGNYTVLHLTTSSQEDVDGTIDERLLNALSNAVEYLIASSRSTTNGAACQECHHISFSYSTDASSHIDDNEDNSNHPLGLHVCHRGKQSLTVDSAFREAKRIFEIICPDSKFLALAKQVEDQVVYRENHDDDDEKDVLESACTMIQAPNTGADI